MASKVSDYSAWTVHRETIHSLYVVQNKRQDEVLETLKQPPFGLDATPAQFERILSDVLNIQKNLKGEDWLAIDYHKSKRKREDGKETVVYVNGVAQNPKKLQRQANRYKNRTSTDPVKIPQLPMGVTLTTPPMSPIQNFDITIGSPLGLVKMTPIMQTVSEQLIMDSSGIEATPDFTYFENITVSDPAIQIEIPESPNWSDWLVGSETPSLSIVQSQSLPSIVTDRYTKLLNPSIWFDFTDWLTPKLGSLLKTQLSPLSQSIQSKNSEKVAPDVVLRSAMGLSKTQNPDMQKASQFVSGIVPERFKGELAAKMGAFDNSAQAQIQAAEVILSMLANNHKSMSNGTESGTLRAWIMEIPLALLDLIIQRKDPTAIAITGWMLEWSISQGFDDVFRRILKANIDKSYLTGKKGGKLLVISLDLWYGGEDDDIVLEIIKFNPSLDTVDKQDNTPLHLAARKRTVNVIKALVEHGANTAARNYDRNTPVEEAISSSRPEIVTWFLENGAATQYLKNLICSDFMPRFQLCKMLWEKYPTEWSKLSARLLIFAAIQGLDEFKAKVEEISVHYEDVNPILEEALCLTMEFLPHYEMSESFYDYHREQNSSDIDDDEYYDEDVGLIESDVLDVFLQYGVDPNAKSVSNYPSPLTSAVMSWTAEDVARLLDHGAKMELKTFMNYLFYKPNSERLEILKHIFMHQKLDMKLNKRLWNGQYLLQAICTIHRGVEGLSIVKHLVGIGAEVNGRASKPKNFTALHFAVQHGRLSTVRYLIEKGAKVRGWLNKPRETLFELCLNRCPITCGWKSTPSHEEMMNRLAIFDLLLENRAETSDDSDSENVNLGNCLSIAISHWPNSKLVDAVIKAGIEVSGSIMLPRNIEGKKSQVGPFSPLQLAIRNGYQETAKSLVEKGADINEAAGLSYGGTALQLACVLVDDDNKLELVEYLLDHGADINATGSQTGGNTALQQACRSDQLNFALIELLLERGADINGPPAEYSGRTALQIACTRDEIDFKLVHLLLEKGANINGSPARIKGLTALQGAVIGGNIELVLILLERGAKVDAEGAKQDGRTALEAAGEHGKLAIAQILLNAYNEIGCTAPLKKAIELANQEGHYGVVKLFEDYCTVQLD